MQHSAVLKVSVMKTGRGEPGQEGQMLAENVFPSLALP